MTSIVRKNILFLIFAPLIGMVLGSYLSTLNLHDRLSFWWTPVVRMQGDVVIGPTDSYVVLHIYGEKLRGEECAYKGLQAFGDRAVGPTVGLRISRVDLPEEGTTKPVGTYDIGRWRVWPVDGVDTVKVYAMHECGGRFVATKITEVKI